MYYRCDTTGHVVTITVGTCHMCTCLVCQDTKCSSKKGNIMLTGWS